MQSNRDLIVEPIGLDVDAMPKPLDWAALFGNAHPVEIEIGMGKGTFLNEQAKSRPDVNFFGIEWARWFWRYASDRMRRQGMPECADRPREAAFFLSEFVVPASVSVLHIYFPDPWPKARHHKRRLIQPKFMPLIQDPRPGREIAGGHRPQGLLGREHRADDSRHGGIHGRRLQPPGLGRRRRVCRHEF